MQIVTEQKMGVKQRGSGGSLWDPNSHTNTHFYLSYFCRAAVLPGKFQEFFAPYFFQCKGFQVDVILLKALFSEVTVQEKKNLEKIILLFYG